MLWSNYMPKLRTQFSWIRWAFPFLLLLWFSFFCLKINSWICACVCARVCLYAWFVLRRSTPRYAITSQNEKDHIYITLYTHMKREQVELSVKFINRFILSPVTARNFFIYKVFHITCDTSQPNANLHTNYLKSFLIKM